MTDPYAKEAMYHPSPGVRRVEPNAIRASGIWWGHQANRTRERWGTIPARHSSWSLGRIEPHNHTTNDIYFCFLYICAKAEYYETLQNDGCSEAGDFYSNPRSFSVGISRSGLERPNLCIAMGLDVRKER
ncbi:uncharacterized protein SPSK_08121 [Sporothrix schenckii 1099-18]|uniref:Uncharacterized protein n=1 Tax=Sporothrix schenckii 1099-18 TaxID=1397361 RepID=A0A0F2MFI5_SPOSC|nr:uncharacterized protein SPSK_08121 [Sporothrix schenckii 1099-18]KJR88438.1 hypothetical protein SPSK_08121 [Sporothrix schenckii 1099-18]